MRKRSITKLFCRDMIYSFAYGKYKYLAFFGIIAFLALVTSLQLKPSEGNSVDIFFLLLQDNGYISEHASYRIPLYWDFVQFIILFLIADFLFHDQESNEAYLLFRCRSRLHYISTKICWIVVQNIFICSGLFVVIYAVSSLVYGDFSIKASPYFRENIESMMAINVTPEQLLLRILLGYIMTSIVLSTILLLCIQLISPIVSFLGVVILCTISTFSGIKWLPAIHSMILKTNIFDMEHHLTLPFSITYSVVVFSVTALLTIVFFKKKDIL